VELRTATPADVPSLHALWARAFDAPLMVPVFETDDGRLARTVVAVEPGPAGDTVLASVYWTPRVVTSADGSRQLRAGCVANVATAPEARGRGLVRRALTVALAQMAADGIDVSLLFTGTPGVYRSSGYETFEVPVLTGHPRPAPAASVPGGPHDGPLELRTDRLPGSSWGAWEPDLPWEALARLHDAADGAPDGRRRPLATVRTPGHWRRRIPLWYRSCELLTARTPRGDVVGYVVLEPDAGTAPGTADRPGPVVRVRELAVDPASPRRAGVAAALADATLARAHRRGATTLEVRLPQDALGRGFADAVLADATASVDATGMLRPVAADPAEADALRASPSGPRAGHHWPGDYV